MPHRLLYIARHHRTIVHPNQRTITLPDLDATIQIETPDTLRHRHERTLRGVTFCRAIGLHNVNLHTEEIILTRIRDGQHHCPLDWFDMSPYIITPTM